MRGYTKGTSATNEIRLMREAFVRAAAAIKASPDPAEAWRDANTLAEAIAAMSGESAEYRGWLVAHLYQTTGMSYAQLGTALGISKSRVDQLVKASQGKDAPVTDLGTQPEPLPVALAIITSPQGVLVERRHDRIPEHTFPGGEIQPGESAADAVRRRVPEETGLQIETTELLGRRIHPRTGRVVVYLAATVGEGEPVLGDPDDLAEVRWASIEETRALMPDMFAIARQHLDGIEEASER